MTFLGVCEVPLDGAQSCLFTFTFLNPPPFFNVFTLLCLLCCRNAEKILGYLNNDVLSRALIPPHVNFSHLTTKDYAEMYKVIKTVKEDHFSALGLDPCLLEDELDKVWGRLSFQDGQEGRCGSAGPRDRLWVAGVWVQKASRDSFFGLISEDLLCAGEKGTGQNPCPEVG